jgi:hypothetical protein
VAIGDSMAMNAGAPAGLVAEGSSNGNASTYTIAGAATTMAAGSSGGTSVDPASAATAALVGPTWAMAAEHFQIL